MDEMHKITKNKMGSTDKIMYFKWIENIIAINGEEESWVVSGPRVNPYQIAKPTLNFEAKVWWTLARYLLCPTIRDNVLIPVRTTLIAGLMVGYKFDVT